MARTRNEEGISVTIAFNLFKLKQQFQIRIGEEISWSQMAREIGLHRNTLERIGSNQTDRVDLETLAKILLFFNSRGMAVGVSDLFEVEISKGEAPAP